MTLLRTMAQGRASVARSVAGVPRSAGRLRDACTRSLPRSSPLLRNPDLAAQLGRRGYERLHRRYTFERRVTAYRAAITELIEATH
jgi:hypothetical protein